MGKVEKTGVYLAVLLIGILMFLIFFSRNGIMDYQALKSKEAQVASQAMAARQANKGIEKEIKNLLEDIRYIKHLAKHEHDMAEPDELIFRQQPSQD